MEPRAVLGVDRDASADEIRRAYRQAVLRLHPDRNPDPGAADAFHAVQEAYGRLRDRERQRSGHLAQDTDGVGVRTLRFDVEKPPDWLPPEHGAQPLRFVVGGRWTALADDVADPRPAAGVPEPARPHRRRWSRDETVALAAALLAAVFAGVAIALAPLIS